MEGVSRLVLVLQCLCILSLVNTLEFTDKETITDTLKALHSYVSDLHAKQELLTAELNSVKIELQDQKLLTQQCLQQRAVPNNLVNRKAKHRDVRTAARIDDSYTQRRSSYPPDSMFTTKKKIDNAVHSPYDGNIRKIAMDHSTTEERLQKGIDRNTRVSGSTAGRVGFTALATNVNDLGVNQVIHFPNIVTNEGNFYNQHTGVFTCGVTGTYVFYVSILDSYQSNIRVALVKDDTAIIHIHTPKITGEFANSSNMVLLHLQGGDSVWVKTIDIRTHQNVNEWSTFSGFLLYPDFQ